SEVYVKVSDKIEKGKPIFKLDSSREEAAVAQAQSKIDENQAQLGLAKNDIAAPQAQIIPAKSNVAQAGDALPTKREAHSPKPGNVAFREIERLEVTLQGRKGQLDGAEVAKQAAESRANSLLPAQLATAQAALQEAQVALEKRTVYAGVSGDIEQFILRVG